MRRETDFAGLAEDLAALLREGFRGELDLVRALAAADRVRALISANPDEGNGWDAHCDASSSVIFRLSERLEARCSAQREEELARCMAARV